MPHAHVVHIFREMRCFLIIIFLCVCVLWAIFSCHLKPKITAFLPKYAWRYCCHPQCNIWLSFAHTNDNRTQWGIGIFNCALCTHTWYLVAIRRTVFFCPFLFTWNVKIIFSSVAVFICIRLWLVACTNRTCRSHVMRPFACHDYTLCCMAMPFFVFFSCWFVSPCWLDDSSDGGGGGGSPNIRSWRHSLFIIIV